MVIQVLVHQRRRLHALPSEDAPRRRVNRISLGMRAGNLRKPSIICILIICI
jgi:hypothetical protein